MKKQIFIFLIITLMFSCKKNGSEEHEPPLNSAPKITSISADKTVLNSGESTNVFCAAHDDDGDQIEYNWSCDCGTFNVTSVSAVTWYAPTVYWQTTCKLTVTVSDSHHNDVDSKDLIITVLVPEPVVITKTLYPTDDSYVSSGVPDGNYGNEPNLYTGQVDYGGAGVSYYLSYLKFDVSSIPSDAQIEKAELILITSYNNTLIKPTGNTYIRWVPNSSWYEGNITYSNRPDPESTILTTIQDITFDVTSEQKFNIKYHFEDNFNSDSKYSLMVRTAFISTTYSFCGYYSKEAPGGSLRPNLYVEYTTK